MKHNWKPSRVAFLDFETQSREDLSTTHKYATSTETRVLTVAVKVDGTMHKFGPYLDDEGKARLARITEGRTIVAHNAPFDAAVWEHCAKLPDREWFDTLPCARAAGLPGRLDDLGKKLTGRGKDPLGKRLVDMLCIIKGPTPAVGPAHKLLMDYNVRDVELLEQIYSHVKDFTEPAVMSVDAVINERGVPVDKEFVQRLQELFAYNKKVSGEEFDKLADGVNPNSPKQVKQWMHELGFDVDSIGKFALRDLAANPYKYFIGDTDLDAAYEALAEALEYRKEVARVGKGKADAALQTLENDGRIREQFVYHAAHTGRWGGRKLQLHNMPSNVNKFVDVRTMPLTYEAAVALAEEATRKTREEDPASAKVFVADVLNVLLRRMVSAPNMLIADYGAVEARCVAWMARCQRMLDLYSDPEASVYLDMGDKVFGRRISKKADPQEYILAKTLVLGCGYGMSGTKFGITCKARCISTAVLEKRGLKAADAVSAYREAYPEIPRLWRAMHDALHAAVNGLPCEAGRCKFYMVRSDLHLELPSGRRLVYRNARIEPRVPGYCRLYGMPENPVPTVIYDTPRMHEGFLYGSKVCENASQAICRDMLADALVSSEQASLHPFLHVHDEEGCEDGPERLPLLMEIMSAGPSWASDFPILVEGYSGPQWTKKSKGYKEAVYLSGKEVSA